MREWDQRGKVMMPGSGRPRTQSRWSKPQASYKAAHRGDPAPQRHLPLSHQTHGEGDLLGNILPLDPQGTFNKFQKIIDNIV